jgi:hypothetical protein
VLSLELANLRRDVDWLAVRFADEYGNQDEAAQRAEQLAAAILRLEWALSRRHQSQPLQRVSAAA